MKQAKLYLLLLSCWLLPQMALAQEHEYAITMDEGQTIESAITAQLSGVNLNSVYELTVTGTTKTFTQEDADYIKSKLVYATTLNLQGTQIAKLPEKCFGSSTLTKIVLPGAVKELPNVSFYCCTKLKDLIITDNASVAATATGLYAPDVERIGDQALWKCPIQSATLGKIKTFGQSSFQYCTQLETMTGCENTDSIYYSAFGNCSKLQATDFGNPIYVDNYAFYNSLEKGKIGTARLTEVPRNLFDKDTDLTSINLPNVHTINESAFEGCTNLSEVILSDKLKTIGGYAFYNCSALQSITLPSGLETIGYNAFNRSGLTSITLPGSVKEIGHSVFTSCANLTKAVLPASLSTIPSHLFSECANLSEVTLPTSPKSIGYEAFSGTKLTSIAIPSTVTAMEGAAFANCTSLEEVQLPENLTEIGGEMFSGCSKLTSITLPSHIQAIGYKAFANTGLTSIDIPATVVNLESAAIGLADVPDLKEVIYHGALPYETNAFYDTSDESITPFTDVTLKVPAFGFEQFKTKKGWDMFGAYVALDETPNLLNLTESMEVTEPWEGLTADVDINLYDNAHLDIKSSEELTAGTVTLISDNVNLSWLPSEVGVDCRTNAPTMMGNGTLKPQKLQVKMKMEQAASAWYYLTMPFDVRVSDIQQTRASEGTQYVYVYSATERAKMKTGWVPAASSDIIKAGTGFIICLETPDNDDLYAYKEKYLKGNYGTFTAVNPLQNNLIDTKTYVLPLKLANAQYPEHANWNFAGNPYAGFFNIGDMSITSPITIIDNTQSNYQAMEGGMAERYFAISPIDDQFALSPFQVFFVQASEEAQSITFNVDGYKLTEPSAEPAMAPRKAKATAADRKVYNLYLSNGKDSDRARFVINAEATTAYDLGKDASKMLSASYPQLYTIAGTTQYAINERPVDDGLIQVGLQVPASGEYTLQLPSNPDASTRVTLIDRGIEVDLTEGEAYTFHAEAGIDNSRFAIRLSSGETTGIAGVTSNKADDTLYNLAGQRVNGSAKGIIINAKGKKMIVR